MNWNVSFLLSLFLIDFSESILLVTDVLSNQNRHSATLSGFLKIKIPSFGINPHICNRKLATSFMADSEKPLTE